MSCTSRMAKARDRAECLFQHHNIKKRGQVILRHPKHSAYRCFLPDLAGFTGFCCTGPSPYSSAINNFSLASFRRCRSSQKVFIRSPRALEWRPVRASLGWRRGWAFDVAFA